MTTTLGSPRRTTRGHLAWITEESARWVSDGLIDEPTRARLLDGYRTDSSERRGVMALALVAVLMCGIGLLLLIGYNWARIPAAVKVTAVFAAVAATFTASGIAYARQRPTVGELLAFAATFIFGNGIWLIADVLHIQGHFPDAFFWFAAGATAVAVSVASVTPARLRRSMRNRSVRDIGRVVGSVSAGARGAAGGGSSLSFAGLAGGALAAAGAEAGADSGVGVVSARVARWISRGRSGRGGAGAHPGRRYWASTEVVIPPRTLKRALSRAYFGCVALTMSFRIVFVTFSWKCPSSRKLQM